MTPNSILTGCTRLWDASDLDGGGFTHQRQGQRRSTTTLGGPVLLKVLRRAIAGVAVPFNTPDGHPHFRDAQPNALGHTPRPIGGAGAIPPAAGLGPPSYSKRRWRSVLRARDNGREEGRRGAPELYPQMPRSTDPDFTGAVAPRELRSDGYGTRYQQKEEK
jgi:hypothetical protein